jgi:hypothetical protein
MPEGVDNIDPTIHAAEMQINKQSQPHEERKEQGGLRVNFQIDDNYLLAHALNGNFSSTEPEHAEDIVALQNKAWEISQQKYDVLRSSETDYLRANGDTPKELGEEMSDFTLQVQQSEEFRKIKKQTEEYRDFVQKQWEDNFPKTASVIQDLTGFDLNKEVSVKITHPDLSNGRYAGNDTIAWGNHEDWDNYSTVYLWHETLHSYLSYSAVEHAVIQLLADNELRTQLNEETTYPPFEGHEELFPLMEKILPRWQQFRDQPPGDHARDIKSFIGQLRDVPEIQDEERKVTSHIVEDTA